MLQTAVRRDDEPMRRKAGAARGIDRVQFHGDRTLDYGDFVGLMERAQEAGIKGFEIVKDPAVPKPAQP